MTPSAPATKKKRITCPHCNQEVLVRFSVDICGVEIPEVSACHVAQETLNATEQWRSTLSPQQHGAIDAAKRSGLFDSFEFALRSVPSVFMPKNIEKAFLNWFKMCRAKTIPPWALREFRILYPGKHIEFYVWEYVGAVIAGDAVSLFLPVAVLDGMKIDTAVRGDAKIIPPDVKGIQQWVRTKMGYVPAGARVALAVMRARCIGEFARPSF